MSLSLEGKMLKILLTDKISTRAQALLVEHGFQVDNLPTMPRESLATCLDDYDAIAIRSATRLDGELLSGLQKLRLIVRGGVGVDNIDIPAATAAGIAVANTPGANTIATAELTFAMILALARNLMPAHDSVLRGEWERAAFRGVELSGKTLGLLGFGRVGREVARRAIAFGMQVQAYDPYLTADIFSDAGVVRSSFEAVIRNADFLSLHLPLNEKTKHMLDKAAFSQMKKGVRIVNCARGGLIDEREITAALADGRIAGLALDVYEIEPPGPNHPLIGHNNVIHVPHLGAYSVEAQAKVADEVAGVIVHFFVNRKYENVLNRKELFPADQGPIPFS